MDSIGALILKAAASAVAAAQEAEQAHAHQAHRAAEASASAFDTLVSVLKRTVYFLIVSGTLFALSVLSYAVVYALSMPRADVCQPLYFDYNFQPDRHMSGAYGEHFTRSSTLNLNSEQTFGADKDANDSQRSECTKDETDEDSTHQPNGYTGRYAGRVPPTAIVDMHMKHTQWHAYTDDVLPEHSSKPPKHVLKPRKSYYIACSLILPESDLNKKLGMFMLEIDLLAMDGTLLASSGRSAMLPHESSITSAARKIVLLGPILIGAVPEARTVVMECFDSYVESSDKPLASLVVRLIVPNGLPAVPTESSYGPAFQVHSGEIRIGKELNVVQRLMKEWFFTCGIFGTLLILVNYGVCFLIIQAWFLKKMEKRRKDDLREQAAYGYRTWQYRENNDRWTDDGNVSDSEWFAGDRDGVFGVGGRYSTAEEFDRAEREFNDTEGHVYDDNADDDEEWDEMRSIHYYTDDDSAMGDPGCDGTTNGGFQDSEHNSLSDASKRADDEVDATEGVHANDSLGDGEDNSSGLIGSNSVQDQDDTVAMSNESASEPRLSAQNKVTNGGSSFKRSTELHPDSEIPSISSERSVPDQGRHAAGFELLKDLSFAGSNSAATKIEEGEEEVVTNGDGRRSNEERGTFGKFVDVLRSSVSFSGKVASANPMPVPTDSARNSEKEQEQNSQEMESEPTQSQPQNSCSVEAPSLPHPAQQTGVRSQEGEKNRPPGASAQTPLHDQEVKTSGAATKMDNRRSERCGTGRPKRKKGKGVNESARRQATQAQRRAKQRLSGKQKEEKILAERVMKGTYYGYEIFTDLDEPDPDLYG